MSHPNPVVFGDDPGVPEVEQATFEEEVAQHLERLEVEQPQDWYFTFGHGNTHRATGEDLMGSYVVIHGTYLSAREQMVAAFGTAWCDQYVDAERAGVTEFSLRRIVLPPVAVEQAAPVTPAEERTGVSDVQHAVLDEIQRLRYLIPEYGDRRADSAARVDASLADVMARLDRIESWVRGGQS